MNGLVKSMCGSSGSLLLCHDNAEGAGGCGRGVAWRGARARTRRWVDGYRGGCSEKPRSRQSCSCEDMSILAHTCLHQTRHMRTVCVCVCSERTRMLTNGGGVIGESITPYIPRYVRRTRTQPGSVASKGAARHVTANAADHRILVREVKRENGVAIVVTMATMRTQQQSRRLGCALGTRWLAFHPASERLCVCVQRQRQKK
jgi:hypothetical protein